MILQSCISCCLDSREGIGERAQTALLQHWLHLWLLSFCSGYWLVRGATGVWLLQQSQSCYNQTANRGTSDQHVRNAVIPLRSTIDKAESDNHQPTDHSKVMHWHHDEFKPFVL